MTKILTVTRMGNAVLRRKCEPVLPGKKSFVRQLSDQMLATMKSQQGVGLAAPQVNQPLRMFVMMPEPKVAHSVVNPTILKYHGTPSFLSWEGCLSIPGLLGLVPRHDVLDVAYEDADGTYQKRTISGFEARIFQHEFDHLEGVLYLDRLKEMKHLIMESEYERVHGAIEQGVKEGHIVS
jgi:peptide deformylase